MTSRRDFIKISALGAGVLAMTRGTFGAAKLFASPDEAKKLKVDLKRTPTYCEVCSGNVPAGFTRLLKVKSGKSLEMMKISIQMVVSATRNRRRWNVL